MRAGVLEGVPLTDMAAVLNRIGVTERDLLATVDDLHRRRILQTVDGLPVTSTSAVTPTRLAAYLVKALCREFAYTEFCSIDSAVYESDVLASMQELTVDIESTRGPLEKLRRRVKRLKLFFEYIQRCEERWIVETKRRDLPGEWARAVVSEELLSGVRDSANAALRSAKRNYGREIQVPQTESRGRAIENATFRGAIISTWPQKDYVFIRDDDGVEWFGHRNDFLTEEDWSRRAKGVRCAFLRGEWRGRPRAVSVRLQ